MMPHYAGQRKQNLRYNLNHYSNNYFGEAVSVKKVQNPQSNRTCTKLLNAFDTVDAIIYQISKQMNGPYHFIEYTKCSYLFPCGKNIIL